MADTVFVKAGDHKQAIVTSAEYTATTAAAVLSAMTSRGLRRTIYVMTTSATLYVNRATTAVTSTTNCIPLSGGSVNPDEIYMGQVTYFTSSTSCQVLIESIKSDVY